MKVIKRMFQLNLFAKEVVVAKRILALTMLPIFLFYMTSVNVLLLGMMKASADEPVVTSSDSSSSGSTADQKKDEPAKDASVTSQDKPKDDSTNKTSDIAKTDTIAKLDTAAKTETTATATAEPAATIEKTTDVTDPIVKIDAAVTDSKIEASVEASTEASTTDTATVTKEASWAVDGKTASIGPVELNKIYKAPQNEKVTVTFTKLPDNPENLTVKEIQLSKEEQASLGSLSDTAYDITSDMENGTFAYDLTLPKPKDQKNVQVKFAEDETGLKNADTVASGDVKIKTDSVSAFLDHFTIYIVTYASDFTTNKTTYKQGENVYFKAVGLTSTHYYRFAILSPNGTRTYVGTCTLGDTDPQTGSYLLSDTATVSTNWKAEIHGFETSDSCNSASNSHSPSDSANFAVTANQATLTVVAPATLVYGNTATLSTTGGSGTGLVTYSAGVSNGCSILEDKLSVIKAEATCSVTATKAEDTNYYNSATSANVQIILSRAGLNVVVNPYSVPYDGASHTATYTVNGVAGENLAGLNLSGTIHTDAGNYTDTWSFNDPNGNYNGLSGSVNDVITKKSITVTADVKNKGRGASDPALTYTSSPSLAPGSFTGSLTRDAGESVGKYAITQGTLSAGPNYNITYVGADLTIDDKTAPSAPTHLSPSDGTHVTTANLTKVDWNDVTDPSTPISYFYQSSLSAALNGDRSFVSPAYTSGALSASEIPTPGTQEGNYYWHVRAQDSFGNSSNWSDAWQYTVDNTGNVENTYSITIIYDKTIPEVTLAIDPVNPDGDNSWYITNPTITLTANDNFNVDSIEYQLNGTAGTWTVYSNPFTIEDGTWQVYYRSIDKAGNKSGEGLKNVKVDTTDPDNVNSFQAEYRPSTTDIRLTWNVNDNDIKDVYIYRGGSRNFTVNSGSRIVINDNKDESYNDNNVNPGQTYFYKAVTRDDAGNNSSASVIKIVIPAGGTAPAVSTSLGTETVPPVGTSLGTEAVPPVGTILGTEASAEGQPAVTEELQSENPEGQVLGEKTAEGNGGAGFWGSNWMWLAVILIGAGGIFFWRMRRPKVIS